MTKVIFISKDNKVVIDRIKKLFEEKRRLGKHLINGGKLDDFKFNIK